MPICARCSACVMAKRKPVCFIVPFFADLVVIARSLYPIPSRTRPSKSSAPMVLNLKVWKSRSLPGLPRTEHSSSTIVRTKAPRETAGFFVCVAAFSMFPNCGTLAINEEAYHGQEQDDPGARRTSPQGRGGSRAGQARDDANRSHHAVLQAGDAIPRFAVSR